MARRKNKVFRRAVAPDPVYNSELVQKLINVVMWRGKKNVARAIVYDALDFLTKKANGDKEKALDFFDRAFEKIIPLVQVKARRVGGSVYQVPAEVSPDRGRALAIRWLISEAAARSDRTMGQRMSLLMQMKVAVERLKRN